jgi:type III restriction enzyme
MICTQSGKIILAETKGGHLKNDDSRRKIALGSAWAKAAGSQYRYFMVFKDSDAPLEGDDNESVFEYLAGIVRYFSVLNP